MIQMEGLQICIVLLYDFEYETDIRFYHIVHDNLSVYGSNKSFATRSVVRNLDFKSSAGDSSGWQARYGPRLWR